jgi:glycosyltransferase involved in cell wall biosynthesis
MKILHIIPTLKKGGAERLVIDLLKELEKQDGIEVKLVVLHKWVQYEISAIQHLVHFIPASIKLSVWKRNIINVDELQLFINDFCPDIIHTHLFEAEIVSRSCYYPNAKWFSHCHGFYPELRKLSFKTFFNTKLFTQFYDMQYLKRRYKVNGSNIFIAVSAPIKKYVLATINTKCYVLPNAIDFIRFNKPHVYHDFPNDLKLISVGRFDINKNHVFLLDVVKILIDRGIDVHLSLYGDGNTKSLVIERIQLLGLEKHVSFMGFVSNIEEYYQQSHIYVHSAKKEALGLTLLEAMAAGLPVISLDGKGNRGLIEDGKNGYMFKSHDAEEFASCILELWEDKPKFKKMSSYAQIFASNFDIVNYTDKLTAIYLAEMQKQ